MKRISIVFTVLMALLCPYLLSAQDEGMMKVFIGDKTTTHILFTSDLTYVDISTPDCIAARIVDASKNMLAIKARKAFEFVTTVSALEANGTMHTFRVEYREFPDELVVDTRPNARKSESGQVNTQVRPTQEKDRKSRKDGSEKKSSSGGIAGGEVRSDNSVSATGVNITSSQTSNFGRGDAPTLEEVMKKPRELYHIADKNFNVEAYCTNVFVYSDLTYIVINVKNKTDIGFEAGDAQFAIENLGKNNKYLATDKSVWAKSSFGTLSCAPQRESSVGYTIPKFTLLKNECLRIYIYEKSGNRNLVLTLTDKDINYAVSPNSNM